MYNKNRPKRLRLKLLGSEHILGRTGGKAETTRKLRELLILYVYTSLFWNIGTVQKCCYMAKNNCQNIYIKKKTFLTIIYDVFLCSWVSTSSTNPLHRLTIPTSTLLREHRTNYLPSLQLVYTVFVRRTGL